MFVMVSFARFDHVIGKESVRIVMCPKKICIATVLVLTQKVVTQSAAFWLILLPEESMRSSNCQSPVGEVSD